MTLHDTVRRELRLLLSESWRPMKAFLESAGGSRVVAVAWWRDGAIAEEYIWS